MEVITDLASKAYQWFMGSHLYAFFADINGDQMVALVIAVLGVWLALTLLKKFASVVCSVVAFFAALYFVAPELYAKGIECIRGLFQ